MKAVQKILFVFIFVVVFLLLKTPVFAQGVVSTTNYQTRDLNIWSQNVVMEVMSAFSCQLAGINIGHKDQKCLGVDPKSGELGFVQNGGALGFLTDGISMLYTAPAHAGQYISYLSQNFGITKSSYAQGQGVGYDSIIPIIGIWGVFRDIAYVLFIFIFIVIGVAIMLRAKIDPRTVMTIQNQIPKLIIGIIMVTFSFAVAGVLIDLMWASTYVVINVMGRADKNISEAKATQALYNHPISYFDAMDSYGDQNTDETLEVMPGVEVSQEGGGVFNLSQKGAGSIQKVIESSFGNTPPPNQQEQPKCNEDDLLCRLGELGHTLSLFSPAGVGNLVQGILWGGLDNDPFGSVISGILGFIVSWFLGGIAFFIILFLLLWNLLKLWLTLLKCYIGILVDIIFAPFWIVGGLLPGASSLGFTGWLKDLLGNLAVFPATVGLFLLAKVFIDMSDAESGPFFVPPLLGHFAGGANTLGPLIALGFVLAAPHVAEGVKKSFKEKFSLDLSGAGESLKVGQGMGIAFLGAVRNRIYKEYVNQEGKRTPTGLLAQPSLAGRQAATEKLMYSSLGRNPMLRKIMLLRAKGKTGKTTVKGEDGVEREVEKPMEEILQERFKKIDREVARKQAEAPRGPTPPVPPTQETEPEAPSAEPGPEMTEEERRRNRALAGPGK